MKKFTLFSLLFFIFLLILLADNQMHHFIPGEPWKILAIKIILIAMLLPLHHWLEEKVIHYLTTSRLITVNGKNLKDRGIKKKDADVPVRNL